MTYHIHLVSGDDKKATKAVAAALGIKNARGNMLPQEKAAFINELKNKGRKVIMIGDGINDAPALVQADLSMAIHSGNYLGNEIGDISLMRGDPSQAIDFIDLAEHVNKKILQNLTFSFLYNIIRIPLAIGGLLSPLVAVFAMLLSSLTVIGNTLLLIRKTR